MSVSGTNTGALAPYTARQMLESALRRAGVKQPQWSSEIVSIAFDQFNLMLNEMLNLGMQLWGRDQMILPLYQNVNQCPTTLGTSVVLTVNQRTLTRGPAAAPFSDNGGTPVFAFDDNFATSCTQTSANGSIGTTFGTSFQVTTIGILFSAPGTFGIFYEYSEDAGVTWTAIDAVTVTVGAGTQEWFWYDVEGVPTDCNAFRIRSVSTDILSVAELYFGNSPNEIPLGVWSLDDWNAMTVKDTPGPPFNYYQQRDLDNPVLYVWPMPNDQAKYMQLVCWRRRYLDQLTDMTQTLDVSRRWQEAITATMARRLCRELPEADVNRYQMLSQEESTALSLAVGEERDPGPMRYNPGLDVYTRL